jgi:hypothetical protein
VQAFDSAFSQEWHQGELARVEKDVRHGVGERASVSTLDPFPNLFFKSNDPIDPRKTKKFGNGSNVLTLGGCLHTSHSTPVTMPRKTSKK